MERNQAGFSLMECLLSLTLFLVVLLFSFECFSLIRKHFFALKQKEENNGAAYAALDRIKTDAGEAGYGLINPMSAGILVGIAIEDDKLVFISKERDLKISEDLLTGETWIPVEDTRGVKKGHLVCFHNDSQGEIQTIVSTDDHNLLLNSPLSMNYSSVKSRLSHLRRIAFYLDPKKSVLRRKVNASPAQPLIENIRDFQFSYESEKNFLFLRVQIHSEDGKYYESTLYPKNMAFSRR